MSNARAELRHLVEVLPVRKIRQARSYLRFLLEEDEVDTVLLRVVDDELTDEDRADIAAARSDVAAERTISWDEVKRELGA